MLKPCLDCGVLFPVAPVARCPACTTRRQRAYDRRRDPVRGSPSQRGYGSDWQRVRLEVLERDHRVCHWCGRPGATSVDHVTPLARGGARLDPENLVTACVSCNSARGGMTARHG